VADLAAAAGISNGMMSKIENGQISPSLSSLQAIATALGLPIAGLFTTVDERLHCSFVRANAGVTIDRRGTKLGHAYELLGHVLGGDVVIEPYLITLEADAVPHTAFQHAGLELIYMLSGEVVYRHGDASYRLRPGDTLLFDSAALHGPQELVALPTRYLSIIVYARTGEPERGSPTRSPRAGGARSAARA
jgi:transcriptional regulator with XRE-family HTH domain